jgi:ABC-type nitrate/sulfonate/bicarbonate transport system substrate-binding protein
MFGEEQMMPLKRSGAALACTLLALASVVAPGRVDAQAAPVPVRIGAASNVLFGPAFVLADPSNGIAAKHGLKLDVRIFASGIATMEAALAGDLDVAFPNTRVLLPLLAKGQACFRGGLTFVDVNTVHLVALSGIDTPQQLIGKKVGTLRGGIGEVALHMWLAKQGIERSQVQSVNVAEQDLPIALAKGSVDAIIWPEPTPSLALQILGNKAHYLGDIGEAFRDVSPVNVTCAWVDKYGDKAMQSLIAAWIEAVNFLKANPDQGAAITAKRLQITTDDVKRIWKNGGWPEGWPANLTDSQIDMYNTYGQYLKDSGELPQMPDMSKWISSKWLKEVDPSRVKFEKYKY